MADVPNGGCMPLPTTGSLGRSLSFQDIRRWSGTAASPLDIPGASRPKASRTCLLTKSLPENADVVLSRSLLQQCRIDDQAADISPRSSLKECSSWPPRTHALARGATSSDNNAWWSTRKGSNNKSVRMVSRIRERGNGAGVNRIGVEATFTKNPASTPRRTEGQVSALSAALRESVPSITDQAELLQMQIHSIPHSNPGPDILSKSFNKLKTNYGLIGTDEQRSMPVSIPSRDSANAGAATPATSYSSSMASATTDSDLSTSATSVGSSSFSSEEQKRAMLDRLMEYFFAVHMNRRQNSEGGSSGTTTPSSISSAQSTSSSQIGGFSRQGGKGKGKGKGKRPVGRGAGGEDSDSDDEANKQPSAKKVKSKDCQTWRLACPFFKRNPQRYKEKRSCVAPGFRTVHRLKEHLYRCHALPARCRRCHEAFPSEELLDAHSQSDTPCQKRNANESDQHHSEGIGLAQEKRLRCRKRCNRTEEDKWREVYMICFPDAISVPSPYFEVPSGQSSELVLYEDFVRRELAKRVRAELESRLEQQWIPIEESLKSQLVEISRNIQLKLLNEFKTLRGSNLRPSEGPDLEEPDGEVSAPSKGCVAVGIVPAADSSSANPSEDIHRMVDTPRRYTAIDMETPASSFAAENQPPILFEPLENSRHYITNETTLGSASEGEQILDALTLPQRYFGDLDWTESDDFLNGLPPSTGDWRNTVFADPADPRLVSAPAALSATASIMAGNGGSFVEDSTFWPHV